VHAPYRSFTCSSSLLSCQRRFNSSYFWHDPLGCNTVLFGAVDLAYDTFTERLFGRARPPV